MTQLVTRFDGAPGFSITPVGLKINGNPDIDEAAVFGRDLGRVHSASGFAIGAFVRWAEEKYGERASQIVDPDVLGVALESIRVYRWVDEKVPEDVRQPALSFQHHKVVASLPVAMQRKLLAEAVGVDGEPPWPVSRLQAAIKSGGADAPVTEVWLVVLCKDKADLEKLQVELESKGRTTKVVERRGKKAAKTPKKKVTARAKNTKKRRGRSRG